MLIAVYDQTVLAIKSCEYRDLVSNNDAHRVFQLIKRECRSMFSEVIRAANQLVQPELRDLSRSDFVPQASELATKRVAAVTQLFDKVPQDVFTGQRVPRHSMRRVRLTPADAALLRQLAVLMHQEPAVDSGAAAAVVSTGLVE